MKEGKTMNTKFLKKASFIMTDETIVIKMFSFLKVDALSVYK